MVKIKRQMDMELFSGRELDNAIEHVADEACQKLEDHLGKKGISLGYKGRFKCMQYVKEKVRFTPAYAYVTVSLKNMDKAVGE